MNQREAERQIAAISEWLKSQEGIGADWLEMETLEPLAHLMRVAGKGITSHQNTPSATARFEQLLVGLGDLVDEALQERKDDAAEIAENVEKSLRCVDCW